MTASRSKKKSPTKKSLPARRAKTASIRSSRTAAASRRRAPESPSGRRSALAPESTTPLGNCILKRLEIVYKGRVQGVGFRFNAEQVALACGVHGWVRNEHNGDVRLVAEGTAFQLEQLLDGIRHCPVGRHIVREVIAWDVYRNEFDDFRIEYHAS